MVYLAVWAALSAFHQHDAADTATIASLAVGAIAAGITVPSLMPKSSLSAGQIAGVANDLATLVMDEEGRALAALLGNESSRIDVGFEFSPIPNLNARGAGREGHLEKVLDYYNDLAPHKPGSGKTVLALQLLVKILEERRDTGANGPVPVRFTASHWNGGKGTLARWLADELLAKYDVSPPAADGLIKAGLLIPVVDGLDEMGTREQSLKREAAMVSELNTWKYASQSAPLVLTCRQDQYRALERNPDPSLRPSGTRLLHAATVTLKDIEPEQAVDFLYNRVSDKERWQPILTMLRDKQDRRLARSLNTPWRLTLATIVYEDTAVGHIHGAQDAASTRSPRELLGHTGDMDEHLLRDYVRAAAASHPPGHWLGTEDAQRWLTGLAVYHEGNARHVRGVGGKTLSRTDIVLHELWPFGGVRRVRITDTVLASIISVPGFVWLAAFAFSRSAFWKVLFFVVLAGYAAALWRVTQAYWVAPRPLDLKRQITWRGLSQVSIAAGIGAIAALISNSWAGAAVAFGAWVGGGISISPTQGLVTRVLPLFTPRYPLRHDMRLSVASGLSGVFALGLAFSQYPGDIAGWICAVAYAALVGCTVASAPWRRYLALLLCTRGRLPWRLGAFLDWACEVGILRTSGIAYQFRHRELQDWLARHAGEHP
jgi:hypothetical protein